MFVERTLARAIDKVSATFPVILLTGPRQVGKTTLLEHCTHNAMRYVSLDQLAAQESAKLEPELFIQRYAPPIIIDEIQYAPSLFSSIKIAVDRLRKPGLFWLTGSQRFHLMHHVSESLAGRVGILNLLGLSLKEQMNQAAALIPFLPTKDFLHNAEKHSSPISMMDLYYKIWRGSFPAIALNPEVEHDVFYESYLQTYIQRDILDLTHVENSATFLKFVRATAARTAQLLNMAELARDVGIDAKTAKAWLSILETSGLIYLLPPYHNNLTKRLVKTPKLYFLDTGLCCHLTRWTSAEALEAGAMSGAILETFIFSEILKSYWHNAKIGAFYFYRDKDQKEIDLLIEQDGILYPVEFKKTSHPDRHAIQHFSVLNKLNLPIGPGAVLCFVNEYTPLSEKVTAIPIYYL